MAIDTKEKRAAVFGVGRPWMRDKFPVATPDEEWRISSGNAYGGNALSAAVASHVITIEGQSFVADQDGVNVNSMRTIRATLEPGDNAVSYVFEETEVS